MRDRERMAVEGQMEGEMDRWKKGG